MFLFCDIVASLGIFAAVLINNIYKSRKSKMHAGIKSIHYFIDVLACRIAYRINYCVLIYVS
jgi:hypothetical protein